MAALKAALDLTPDRDAFVTSLSPEMRQALSNVGWLGDGRRNRGESDHQGDEGWG
jgi:hypothetical protein